MTTGFGIKIISKDNRVLIDRKGILQTWVDSVSDNLDGSYPVYLRLYLPEETMAVQEFSLSFKTERFRSYTLKTLLETATSLESETAHKHSWPTPSTESTLIPVGEGDLPTGDEPGHSHQYYPKRLVSGASNHDHELSGTSDTDGEHSHGTVSHDHGLDFGINVANTNPGNISIAIQKDGGSWSNVSYTSSNDINMLSYIDQNNVEGWYTIRFSTDRLSRVTASYMLQSLVSVDLIEEE